VALVGPYGRCSQFGSGARDLVVDPTQARSIVETGYDSVADRYAELEGEGREWPRMRWLMELLAHVEAGGAVLDIECGNGVPATRAISERFEATGIDAALPGVVFLSGGQSDRDATERLNAVNKRGPAAWATSFSFSRALQAPALQAWSENRDKDAAQNAFLLRAKCNGAATKGAYRADMELQLA
jgi:hypothetical protein